jgi:hypothetical protein
MSLKSLKYLEHKEANHFHHLAIIHRQKFRLKFNRKIRLKRLEIKRRKTNSAKISTFKRKTLFKIIAKCMKSYLKQPHTKEIEKIRVSSYKLFLNFNNFAWNINKHCAYILKKSPVTSMFKTTSKIEKFYRMCE